MAPTTQSTPIINMENSPEAQITKGPSAKEVQAQKAEAKRIKEHNKEFLEEAEMRYRNAELNTMSIEINVRAMKAFIESENLRDEYLNAVSAKEKRDTPLPPPEESRIIT